MKTALLPLFGLLTTMNVFAQAQPTVSIPDDVSALLNRYATAWSDNDPAAVAALFAPDGIALPNGQVPATGFDDIQKTYQSAAGMPLSLRPIAYGASGDLAYVIGGFGPAPGQPDFGKFTLILRRSAAGNWLIVSDMDNSNAPLPPPPTAQAAPATP